MSCTPKLTVSPGPSSPYAEKRDEEKVGYILANGCRYEIGVGDTKIGRDPSICSVVLDDATVSKLHAVVESAGSEDSFIYDSGSTNKTRIGKMVLKPHCRYKINNNDKIILGNTTITYLVNNEEVEKLILASESSVISDIGEINVITNDNLGVRTNVNHRMISLSDDKITGTSSPEKTLNEIFQTPPPPFLKEPFEKDKKQYYVLIGDKSPDPDIFSFETQCEVLNEECNSNWTESKNFNGKQSRNTSSKVEDTCTILGVKLNCEVENKCEIPKSWKFKGNKSLSNNCSPSKLAEKNKAECPTTSDACDSLDEDIFELQSQCPLKPKNDVESAARSAIQNLSNHKELCEINISKQETEAGDSSREKITKDSCETNLINKSKQAVAEESQLSFLNDGEDDKLCEIMRITSPLASSTLKTPSPDKKQRVEIESVKCDEIENMSDDIFDLETQVTFETVEKEKIFNTNKFGVQPNEVQDRVTISSSKAVVMEKEKFQEKSNDVFKIPKDSSSNVQSGYNSCEEDEDMIMTQIYDMLHNERKREISNVSQKNVTSDKYKSSSSFEGGSELQDALGTQVFIENECFRDIDDLPDTQAFQDDIPTQMYHRDRETLCTKSNVDCDSRSGVESLIQQQGVVDSGDETDSDLEAELYSIDHVRKVKTEATTKLTLDRSKESLLKKDQAECCTTDCPVNGDSDIDGDEDFIETQMFPSEKAIHSNHCTTMDHDIKPVSRNTLEEDDILTQILTQGNKCHRSASESSDKTDSDIVEITSNFKSQTRALNSTHNGDHVIDVDNENSNLSESSNREMSPLLMDKDNIDIGLTCKDLAVPEVTRSKLVIEPSDSSTDVRLKKYSGSIPCEENEDANQTEGLIRETSPPPMEGVNCATASDVHTNCGETVSSIKRSVEYVQGNRTSDVTALSDSDVTDCEDMLNEELQVHVRQGVRPLLLECAVIPSTSAEAQKTRKRSNRAQSKLITAYFPSKDGSNIEDQSASPWKRTRRTLSISAVPVKKSRAEIEVLDVGNEMDEKTQSRKLRSRLVREAVEEEIKKKRKQKTAAKERLMSEIDLENIICESDSIKSLRSDKSARMSRRKTASVEETVVRRSMRSRRREESRSIRVNKSRKWRIAFTGIESTVYDNIITILNGEKWEDVSESHVLVTDRVRRTVKFLSAVALGIPVVSPKWLSSSQTESKFQNPWDYLLDDASSEKRWGFNLKESLEKWGNQKLLNGYSVFATESTKPPVKDILSIVRCCGGIPLTTPPDIWPDKSIVLTCNEDKKSWPMYKHRHVKIVHYEFLLSSVLTYLLDFKTFKLR